MKTLVFAATTLSALALLSACDDDRSRESSRERRGTGAAFFDHGDGAIGMDGDKVVIQAGGQKEKAIIGADGSLTIGGVVIDTDSAGRTALKAYDAAAVAMKAHAIALGRTGAEFGVDVLKDVVRGLFDNADLDEVGDRARTGARDLVATVRDLCTRLETVHRTQQAAAEAVPAFKPFAVLDASQVEDCYKEIEDEPKDDADKAEPEAPPASSVPAA